MKRRPRSADPAERSPSENTPEPERAPSETAPEPERAPSETAPDLRASTERRVAAGWLHLSQMDEHLRRVDGDNRSATDNCPSRRPRDTGDEVDWGWADETRQQKYGNRGDQGGAVSGTKLRVTGSR